MLRHQITLLPDSEDELDGQEHESVTGFQWWAVPSERGWLLINGNFGYVALVPDGEDKLIDRVGRTAIETVQRLAPGESKDISISVSPAFEDIHWQVGGEMPDFIPDRIARVLELAQESKDQYWFEKAIERMNKSEHVSMSGFRFIPEEVFVAKLEEIQGSLEDYLEDTSVFTRLWNLIRGRKPWLDGQ